MIIDGRGEEPESPPHLEIINDKPVVGVDREREEEFQGDLAAP